MPEIPVALIAIRVRKIAEDDGACVDAVHAVPVARGRRDGGANGARVADFARRLDIAVNLEVCEHEQPHGHVGADARVRREAVDAAPAGRGAADAHEDAPRRRDPRERHAVKDAADVAGQRAEDALAAGRRRVARERRVGRLDARAAGHARLVVGPLRPQLRHVCREARVGRRPGHDGLRGPVAPVDPDLRGRGLGESEQRGRRRRRGCERQRRTAAGRHPTRASRLRTLRPSRRGPGRAFRSRRRRPGTRDRASPSAPDPSRRCEIRISSASSEDASATVRNQVRFAKEPGTRGLSERGSGVLAFTGVERGACGRARLHASSS